jgi:hypothetical protein
VPTHVKSFGLGRVRTGAARSVTFRAASPAMRLAIRSGQPLTDPW